MNQARQASLFPDMKAPAEIVSEDCVTWVLVQHEAVDGVHVELSRPEAQDETGYVVEWFERILLPVVDPRGPLALVQEPHPEPSDDIDFPVIARTSDA